MAVETAMRKQYSVKLNCRIGWLKFNGNQVFFDNLASKDNNAAADVTSMTSCNSEFRGNKLFMTNFR